MNSRKRDFFDMKNSLVYIFLCLLTLTFVVSCIDEDIEPNETLELNKNDSSDDGLDHDDTDGNDDGTNDDGTNDDGTNDDGTNDDDTNDDGTNDDGTNDDGTNGDGTNDAADGDGDTADDTVGGTTEVSEGTVWIESDRMLVIEAENTASRFRNWRLRSEIDGYSGTGYMEFRGNSEDDGEADSPLEYEFRIENGGNYRLEIHTSRDPGDREIQNHYSNDAFIRMEGDFEEVSGDEGYASKSALTKDSRFRTVFGDSMREWEFATHLRSNNEEEGENIQLFTLNYRFKAGETYKLIISGREKYYIVDRIIISGGYNEADRRSITRESRRE